MRSDDPDQGSAIETTRERFLEQGVVLAIRLGEGSDPVGVARAAARGGIRVLELTLTTPGALGAIADLASEPDCLVGAGTVLSVADARAAAGAGARFALSPVHDPAVLAECERLGLLFVPGAATPTEILAAHRDGARLVKVFPSGPLGGPAFLRRVRGPLPQIPLVPTSGPDAGSIADYLAAGAVAVGVGPDVIGDGRDLGAVEERARATRGALDRARGG